MLNGDYLLLQDALLKWMIELKLYDPKISPDIKDAKGIIGGWKDVRI